jgi:hypothetical protein
MQAHHNVPTDDSIYKLCSPNDRGSLQRIVPTAGTKNLPPKYENMAIKNVVPCCQLRDISIIIIIELLGDSKDSGMQEAGVVGAPCLVRVVRRPGNGLFHGRDWCGYIDMTAERWDFREKISALQILSKDHELCMLTAHNLQTGL